MNTTIETVAEAIEVNWHVAHESPSTKDAVRRWGRIADMVSGIQMLLIEQDNFDVADECHFLWSLARERMMMA